MSAFTTSCSSEGEVTRQSRAASAHLESATYRNASEAYMLEQRANQIAAETHLAKQKGAIELSDSIRRSIAHQYPLGKDCSTELCHPYMVALKDVLWGFTDEEFIDPETTGKYKAASDRALYNLQRDIVKFSYKQPVVPNLVAGLPLPYSFNASNTLLSADDQPYWFYPNIADPNPGKPKHGRIVWECRDVHGGVVASKIADFKENRQVDVSCNDVATKFKEAAKKDQKKGFSLF